MFVIDYLIRQFRHENIFKMDKKLKYSKTHFVQQRTILYCIIKLRKKENITSLYIF